MNSNWSTQTKVGEFVEDNILCAQNFEDLSIDFCCGGETSLENACLDTGLEPEDVLNRLRGLENPKTGQEGDLNSVTPGQLTLQIESEHHEYLKKALPRIAELLTKVLSAHGDRFPELIVLEVKFAELREELEPHLLKEERVLFPLIRKLESEELGHNMKAVSGPIRVMLKEHDQAGDLLKNIREITAGFKVPEEGCQSFRLLYEELKFLEKDTHLHIHKENNILFEKIKPVN